ncbi:MAG: hypothetical protein WDW38_006704 [Sanguina aurantia]
MGVRDLLKGAWSGIDKFFTLQVVPPPKVLYTFKGTKEVAKWRVFSDNSFGGSSSAALELSPSGKSASFSGCVSKKMTEGSELIRSGYCGMNSVMRWNLDLQPYDFLTFRVKGDGNTYTANIRLDQFTGGDEEAWQARLKPTKTGEWEDVHVDFKEFIFTFRGRTVQNQEAFAGMARKSVMAVGITIGASEDMEESTPFQLEVESIKADTHPLSPEEYQRRAFEGLIDGRQY